MNDQQMSPPTPPRSSSSPDLAGPSSSPGMKITHITVTTPDELEQEEPASRRTAITLPNSISPSDLPQEQLIDGKETDESTSAKGEKISQWIKTGDSSISAHGGEGVRQARRPSVSISTSFATTTSSATDPSSAQSVAVSQGASEVGSMVDVADYDSAENGEAPEGKESTALEQPEGVSQARPEPERMISSFVEVDSPTVLNDTSDLVIIDSLDLPHSVVQHGASLGHDATSHVFSDSTSPATVLSSTSSFDRPSISSSSPPHLAPGSARLGTWFSNILQSSKSSSHLPLSPGADSSTSSRQRGHSTSSSHSSLPLAHVHHPSSPSASTSSSTSPMKPVSIPSRLDRLLDRAVQYFLDTDSRADLSSEEIWMMGVRHSGFSDPTTTIAEGVGVQDDTVKQRRRLKSLRKGARTKKVSSSHHEDTNGRSPSPPPLLVHHPMAESTTNGWPTSFYCDFYSRIALTYRSSFPPIFRKPSLSSTSSIVQSGVAGVMQSLSLGLARVGGNGRASAALNVNSGAEEGLMTDTGWGCMLRTGQSLLANALLSVHLGRDWRKALPTSSPISTSTSAVYARLLSLFIDSPSPLSPFSVHHFALAGANHFSKSVGEWFGPSTAAGSITMLVSGYEAAGMGVVNASGGVVFKSEVSRVGRWTESGSERPVLVLLGVRLGIEGVNPIYYDGLKATFTFPQSVGIAGGRPGSSYYFVGSQATSLFYLDPHHPQPSIPLRTPLLDDDLYEAARSLPLASTSSETTPENDGLRDRLDAFFSTAYTTAELASYHSSTVRKMALRNLDPSMLLGFLIRDEEDWKDWERRVGLTNSLHSPIFTLASSPPSWMTCGSNDDDDDDDGDDNDAASARSRIGGGERRGNELMRERDVDNWDIETDSGGSALGTPGIEHERDGEWEAE